VLALLARAVLVRAVLVRAVFGAARSWRGRLDERRGACVACEPTE